MDKGCKKLRRWLLARRESLWHLPTGSFFERPLRSAFSDPTDVDFLVSPSDLCAIPRGEIVPSYFAHEPKVLTIYTNGVHAGFANLFIDNDNQFFQRSNIYREQKTYAWEKKVKGPSLMTVWNISDDERKQLVQNVSQYDPSLRQMPQVRMDEVEAIHCPYWPPEAAEWVTRNRDKGWPSSSDIEKVVNSGCHFVAKPHQSNPNDVTQWRFSFSQAELILIHSWTDVQMQIYHILRLIKSEVVKSCGGEDSTVLCTYFFKTLMLWACEEKPREFWEEKNLDMPTSIVELIANMIEWLIDRRCPNYFIPSNNMIDYLSEDIDLNKEIELLLHQAENCVRSLLKKAPKANTGDQILISVSNKVIFTMLLRLNFLNIINTLDPGMNTRILKYLTSSEEFSSNIRDLYLGIVSHLKMMHLRDKCPFKTYELKFALAALGHLEKAMEYNFSGNTDVIFLSSDSAFALFENMMVRENSAPAFPRSSKNITRPAVNDNCQSILIQMIFAKVAKEYDDYIPAPLYVVAAAYRANLLFTSLINYEAALLQCDEARNWRCRNVTYLKDPDMIFYSLPFIITNEWSAIFDEQVQTVLGFVLLYRKICKRDRFGTELNVYGDECNVVLRLCAAEFLNYIRYRCQRRLGLDFDPLGSTPIKDLTLNPMFSDIYFREFSASFLYAASHIGLKSDLACNQNGNY